MQKKLRIPTIIGLPLIILLVGLFGWLTDNHLPFTLQAQSKIQAKNLTVSNLTHNSFAVSWWTEKPTTGFIKINGPGKKNVTYFDVRYTLTNKLVKYANHYITVRDLLPNSQYQASIYLDGKKEKLEITTGPQLALFENNQEPAYGKIIAGDGQPIKEAIVYLTPVNGQTLSVLSNNSGTWMIPLNLTRAKDLQSFLEFSETTEEDILIQDGPQQSVALTNAANDSPVPEMTIGKSYDFRFQTNKQNKGFLAENNPQKSSVLGAQSGNLNKVSLTQPANNSFLPTNLPLIKGTGIPGKKVTITLGINGAFSDATTVGADGLWRYTPKKRLTAGKQAVTITTVDKQNKPVAITHTFEILKSGTQVLGDATPSATLTPTAEPTISTDSSELVSEPLPESGNYSTTLMLLIVSMGLITASLFIFWKTNA